jgi:hypothetical protein
MDSATMQRFCDPRRLTPDLTRPWSAGEYSYATNGYVAMRVPRLPDVAEKPDAPKNIDDLIHRARDAGAGRARVRVVDPGGEHLRQTKCETCGGSGKVCVCPACGGEGVLDCEATGKDGSHWDDECECPKCGGAGAVENGETQVDCIDCGGTGVDVPKRVPVEVCRVLYAGCHLALLAALQNCEIAPIPAADDVGADTGSPFWFDGGCGVLMPMRS